MENISVLNDLFDHIVKNNEYGILHKESSDKRGIDVALAYRKDEFKILNTEFLAVHFSFEPETTTRDILYTKGIASEVDTFHVFVNHWSSRRGGQVKSEKKRIVAAKIVRAKIDSIQKINKNAKIILIGDFNDEPTNYSLTRYLQANNKKINAKYFELYNLMYDLSNSENKGTYSFKNKWDMIDNLIVSQSLIENSSGYSTEFTSGKIFNPHWLLYRNVKANIETPSKTYGGKNYYGGFSDHLPVYFQLTKE